MKKMSEVTDTQRPARPPTTATRQTEPEHLPCPRCDSINTKFCYYNNYNLSQPRHFCKACRRYWTVGGTLRNVPVGGGSRKNSSASNKRSRTAPSSSSSTVNSDPLPGYPVLTRPGSVPDSSHTVFGEVNLNEMGPSSDPGPDRGQGFTTLLGLQHWDGFGLGLGSGIQGMGFGIGAWDNLPSEQGDEVNAGEVGGGGCGGVGGGATWQMGGGEGGLSDGDCFGWPDLSISTPGKSLKQ